MDFFNTLQEKTFFATKPYRRKKSIYRRKSYLRRYDDGIDGVARATVANAHLRQDVTVAKYLRREDCY